MSEQIRQLTAIKLVVSQSVLGSAARSAALGKVFQEPILAGGPSCKCEPLYGV